MEKNNKGGIIGIVITVIILIILVVFSNTNSEKFSIVENFANAIVMPIENGLTYLKNKLNNNNSFFENVDKLKEASKTLENYFQIKLTYPQDSKKISRVEKNRFLFAEI